MAGTTYTILLKNQTGDKLKGLNIDPKTGEILPEMGAGTAVYTGSNAGVEHNRYARAINPIINRYTGGMWEKGMRLGRAGIGMVDIAKNQGAKAVLGSVGFIIVLQFVLMELTKWWEKEKKEAKEENEANYLKIKTGQTILNNNYRVSRNFFTGKLTYSNQ
ncbi:MAG: hypothetical protein M0R51_09765 [Clostridia bacterium]|jgi:hypothetical protein|nr:hypothetical protein [Clostridia bacterium]